MRRAYTLAFVNKRVGLDLRPRNLEDRSTGCASLASDRVRIRPRHGDASNKVYPSIIRTGVNSTQSARSKTTSNGSIPLLASASASCL
jgi:hypothetical protein